MDTLSGFPGSVATINRAKKIDYSSSFYKFVQNSTNNITSQFYLPSPVPKSKMLTVGGLHYDKLCCEYFYIQRI